jgi:hypothetical protein
VQLSTSPFSGYRTIAWLSGSTRSYFISGLRSGTRYHVRVVAVNLYGAGRPSWWVTGVPYNSSATPSPNYSGNCPAPRNTPGGQDLLGGCWPGPHNTGVPAGTTLSPYTGSCSIYSNDVVIDSKLITCSPMLIYGTNVTIRRSLIRGTVSTNQPSASFSIIDSEVDGGSYAGRAVGLHGVTVIRSDIHGSQHAVECNYDCVVRDSWLHDTYDGSSMGWHQNAFISAGTNVVVTHNTLYCVGGCTADLSLFAEPEMSYATVQSNLLIASLDTAACVFGGAPVRGSGGSSDHILFRSNVFQPGSNGNCGFWQPVAYFDSSVSTNVWSGNVWTNGTVVASAY